MHVKVLFLCIALAAAAAGLCNAKDLPETVIVETKYGKVEGDVIKVPGEDFVAAAFKGIRFGIAKLFQVRLCYPMYPRQWESWRAFSLL